jgi:putative N-acetyltransferase (TIGR04045 family)
MVFDPFNRFTPQDFVFKIARTQKEIEGFWALRRAIFCEEQKVFRGSDRDEFDPVAIPIVCETLIAGMEDSVVGVVRIDEREPNVCLVPGWVWRRIFGASKRSVPAWP